MKRNRSGRENGGNGFGLEALEERRVLSATSLALAPADVGAISIATDTHGNVLVLGRFSGIVDFDPRPDHVFAVHSGVENDSIFFIAKYSPTGAPLWVIPHAREGAMILHTGVDLEAIATDSKDNVYVSGTLNGSFDANPVRTHVSRVRSTLDRVDILVWKLNPQGGLVYATTQPTPTIPSVVADLGTFADKIAVDRSGSVYLAGRYPTPDIETAAGVWRFDPSGKLLWSNQLPTLPRSGALGITAQGESGFAYELYDDSVGLYRFSAKGRFVSDVKLATVPGIFHAPLSESTEPQGIASVAFDANDNALICGTFDEIDFRNADFDAGPRALVLGPRITGQDYETSYLAKYTPRGRPIFAEALSADGGDVRIAGAGIDRSGRIHVTGSFGGTMDMNADSRHVSFLKAQGAAGYQDVFAALYNGDGTFIQAESIQSGNLDDEGDFFGFAPYAASPKAAVLAESGDYLALTVPRFIGKGIVVFAM